MRDEGGQRDPRRSQVRRVHKAARAGRRDSELCILGSAVPMFDPDGQQPGHPLTFSFALLLFQEIKVLSQLKHRNIVQYYGSEIVRELPLPSLRSIPLTAAEAPVDSFPLPLQIGDRFYIYLEYVYPGSINKYVREHCGAITESIVRNFTLHILRGLAYLHGKKTIHRSYSVSSSEFFFFFFFVGRLRIFMRACSGRANFRTRSSSENIL